MGRWVFFVYPISDSKSVILPDMACSRIPSSAARENNALWQQEWQRKRRGAVDCLSVEKWSISLRDAGVREVATSQPSSPSTLSLKHSQVGYEMELIKNS